ncbi:MAG: MarR family winged helix-turn-helix transcriptional regulator [Pseudobutyrivibrio sp.]|nr:MarR family winged helix-turn-helix transcriptional regulator [Pseudobutyrivibrio sp.]
MSDKFDNEDLRHIGFWLENISREIKKAIGRGLINTEDCGESACNKSGWILGFIKRHDGPVYQKDIEAILGMPKSTLADILQSIEKEGYIQKLPVKDGDSRKKEIILTEKGLAYTNAVEEQICAVEKYIIKDISKEDLAVTRRVLEQIKKNASEYGLDIN